jgi:hypothetical protein
MQGHAGTAETRSAIASIRVPKKCKFVCIGWFITVPSLLTFVFLAYEMLVSGSMGPRMYFIEGNRVLKPGEEAQKAIAAG